MDKVLFKLLKFKTILLIILLASILRIYNVNHNPKSMYGDSLTLVYDAYSILKTGMDQTGQFLPVYFSMGGGRPPVYIYATIPFVALLGPTAIAARSVSILSGIGIVLLLYLICLRLSRKIALYAALLAAITPWELSLSRGAFESHFALFLGLLGLYAFLKRGENNKWLFISAISFVLSMQTYSTYVLTIPLFVFLLMYSEGFKTFKQIVKPSMIIFLTLILMSLLFSVYISYSRGSKDRFTNIQIFNQPDLQNQLASKVKSERAYSLLNPELADKFHNRVLANLSVLTENYANNFGLRFLFLQGDRNPRHNPASSGELFWFCLPLLILGGFSLYRNNKKVFLFVFLWASITPIAGSLVGAPHALRNSFMLPPLLILCAHGFPKSKRIKFLLLIFFLIQLPFFINRFYFLSPNLNAQFWSYSAKKATELALENKNKYDYIFLSTSIPDMEFAYPVYTRVEPKDFIYQKNHETKLNEFNFLKFGNVYLGSVPNSRVGSFMKEVDGSVFYLGPIEDQGFVDIKAIQRDENEQPLFVVSTKNK